MSENAIVIVFDPSLDWIQRSNIEKYVKVEPYRVLDVPNESTIYDISMLSPSQQQRTDEKFCKALFEYQVSSEDRKQYLVIFEEAHTYFYQGSMRSKNAVNSVRMLSVGRNVDIACSLISQFASMLDKFAIKHSVSQVWCGFSKEYNDLKYLKSLLGSTVELLPKLSSGEFLYLTRDKLEKIAIEPFESHVEKTEFETSFSQQFENFEVPKKRTDSSAMIKLLIALLWFFAILVALSQRRI